MADRELEVRLTLAHQSMSQGLNQAGDDVEQWEQRVSESVQTASDRTADMGTAYQGAADDVSGATAQMGDDLAGHEDAVTSAADATDASAESLWSWEGAAAAAGTAATVAAAGVEAYARSQQSMTETADRVAGATGRQREEIVGLAAEVHNATTDLDELVAMMETASQRGLEDPQALQDYATTWDMIGDASGEAAGDLAAGAQALEFAGVAAGEEQQAMAALGFVLEDTTSSIGGFLQFVERVGRGLGDNTPHVNELAAALSMLEERGFGSRDAYRLLRQELEASGGDLQTALRTLGEEHGFAGDQLADYVGQVEQADGVIERNADGYRDTRTAVQELTAALEAQLAQWSGLIHTASSLAPVIGAGGMAVSGFAQLSIAASAAGTSIRGLASRAIPDVVRSVGKGGARAGLAGALSHVSKLVSPGGLLVGGIGAMAVAWQQAAQNTREQVDQLEQLRSVGADLVSADGPAQVADAFNESLGHARQVGEEHIGGLAHQIVTDMTAAGADAAEAIEVVEGQLQRAFGTEYTLDLDVSDLEDGSAAIEALADDAASLSNLGSGWFGDDIFRDGLSSEQIGVVSEMADELDRLLNTDPAGFGEALVRMQEGLGSLSGQEQRAALHELVQQLREAGRLGPAAADAIEMDIRSGDFDDLTAVLAALSGETANVDERTRGLLGTWAETASQAGGVAAGFGQFEQAASAASAAMGDTEDAAGSSTDTVASWRQSLDDAGLGADATSMSVGQLAQAVVDGEISLYDAQMAANEAGIAISDLNDVVADGGQQFETAADRVDAWQAQIRQTTDPLIAAERAQLRLADAEDKLAEARRGQPELVDQALDRAAQASERLADARDRVADAEDRVSDAVAGVQDARENLARTEAQQQDRIEDAERRVADAERELAEARRAVERAGLHDPGSLPDARDAEADATRNLEDAERDLERTKRDASWAIEDASGRVADAQDKVVEAEQGVAEASEGVADAQRGVVEAHRDVQQARIDAMPSARDIRSAELDLVEASQDLDFALMDVKAAMEDGQLTSDDLRGRLDHLRGMTDETDGAFSGLLDSLDRYEDRVRTLPDVTVGLVVDGDDLDVPVNPYQRDPYHKHPARGIVDFDAMHDGGWVVADGQAGRHDEAMRLLQDGEYVVNARAAAAHGGALESINAGRGVPATPAAPMQPASAAGPTTIVVESYPTVELDGRAVARSQTLQRETQRVDRRQARRAGLG